MRVWSTMTKHVPLEVSTDKRLQKRGVYTQCSMVDFNWDLLLPRKILDPFVLKGYFSENEINKSVFSLPGKSRQCLMDSLYVSAIIFWDDIKRDIFKMFDYFYNSDNINTLKSVNQTFITLISKRKQQKKFRIIVLLVY